MSSMQTHWQISGAYFENCNCDVVCPCLFSTQAPLSAKPTRGACEVAFAFHIEHGAFGSTPLDGLNAVVVARTPEAMGAGNWSLGLYVDERANEQQRQALQSIFSGAVGGPLGAFAPLVSTILGVKAAPITYHQDGKKRSVEIPNIMHMSVQPLPSLDPEKELWAENAHPFASSVAMAVGREQSTWADYGMRWDNSGKNGHYAPINWSNS